MDTKNPAPAEAGREAEYKTAGAQYLAPSSENFNQKTSPKLLREIMTQEWWRSVIPEDIADDLRFARQVERAFKHGPVAFFYMLRECGRTRSVMTHIESVIDRFAELDPDLVKAMGADEFVQLLAGIGGGKKK